MWFWNPSTQALADNLPRSAGQYVRMGGDTPVTVLPSGTGAPTTAPDVADESNIRIAFVSYVWCSCWCTGA